MVAHLLAAELASDIVGDELHRSRAIEGQRGHDLAKLGRLHLLERAAHPRTLHLEDARHLARGEEGIGLWIVHGNVLLGEPYAAGALDPAKGAVEDGEGGQAQHVQLEQADGLYVFHAELRDDPLAPGGALQGGVLHQRAISDQHAGGVRRKVARDPLDGEGVVNQFLDVRLGLVHLFELGDGVEPVLDGLLGAGRNELGDIVDLVEGDAEGAAHVADGAAGHHGAKGGDLGGLVLAVPSREVVDHLLAAVLGVVQVDVGHGDAARVEESLEQQPQAQGLEVRNP